MSAIQSNCKNTLLLLIGNVLFFVALFCTCWSNDTFCFFHDSHFAALCVKFRKCKITMTGTGASCPCLFTLISHQLESRHFAFFEVQRRVDGLFFVRQFFCLFISSWLLRELFSCLWHWNTCPATKSLEEAAVRFAPRGKYPDLDYDSPTLNSLVFCSTLR